MLSSNVAARLRPAILAFFIFLVATVAAQVSRTTGAIQGVVIDQSGSVVVDARVQLTNRATNQARNTASDSTGTFHFTAVPVGIYHLRVEASGFAAYQNDGIETSVGRVTSVSVRLAPATVQQQVTVSGETPAIEATQTTVATTVGPERIEESPVVNRNYLSFVLLAPSLSSSNSTRSSSSASSTVLGDSGFAFAGQRPRSNSLYIDGVENNDEFEGSVRTQLSPETIQEFQVVNNGLSAESGGGAGGSINVVTKNGANIRHGDVFLFMQNGTLNAREPLTNEITKPALDRERIGLALGGPVIRNRTFLYVAGEQERSRDDDSSLIAPSVAQSINALLDSGAYPRLITRRVNPATFRVTRAETEASGRLDHEINSANSLLVKYAFTNNREAGDAFNVGGLVDPSSRGSSFTRDQGVTVGLSSVLSSTTLNNFNFQISRRGQVLRTGDQLGPGVSIAGTVEFGRPYSGNSSRTEDHYEALDGITILRGQHLLKFGFDLDHIRESAAVVDGFGAYYIFPSQTAFLSGAPDEYLQSWGNPRTKFAVTRYAGFFQDHLKLSRRVTLDAGLRYDFEQLTGRIPLDYMNVAPRIGMAFSPSEKWVLRVGFGIFYDRYLLAATNRVLEWNGPNAFQQVAYGPTAAQIFNTSLGGAPLDPVQGIAPSIFTVASDLRTPYSETTSAAVERLLTRNMTISGTYLFSRGARLPRTVNVNLPPPVILTATNAATLGFGIVLPQELGRDVFGPARRNSAVNNIYEWQNASSSTYHGASFVLHRRLADEIAFSGSYTFSKSLDDASDFPEQPQNPFALRTERALSANDQRHRFVFSGTFDLPFGEEENGKKPTGVIAKLFGNIETAPIFTVGSGRPVNPLTGFDANHNGAFPFSSRPQGLGRNTLHTPIQVELDLRVLKYFKIGEHGKLDWVAEAFNVLNHTHVVGLNQYFGPGAMPLTSFDTPNRAGIARQFQFSIDFEF